MPTYYLNADTGNDTTGDGSSGLPWLTFGKAHTAATNGDTIIFQDSTAHYTHATVTITKSLNLKGESVGGAIIDYGVGRTYFWFTSGTPVWTLELLDFTGGIFNLAFQGPFRTQSVAPDITFTNCRFYGIEIAQARTGIISHIGNGSTLLFISCLFYDNKWSGTATGGIIGTISPAGVTATLQNCVLDYNAGAGFEASTAIFAVASGEGTVNYVCTNCIFQNNQAAGNDITFGATSETMDYCCTHGNTSNFLSVPTGTGNITGDPLFIDQPNNIYSLAGGSPCIDAGTII